MPGGPESILHEPSSGNDAFAAGDYLTAARRYPQDSWQHWAARALMGKTDDAAGELARFGAPEAAFYAAVTHWIAGDDERALAGLDRLPSDHARRLAGLIRRRPITVVAQLPWNRRGPWDVLCALQDPAFRVRNISFHPDDVQNHPYADVRTLVPDETPDFYIAEMVEWHLVPPNVRDLGCPILGHSSDFDLHIQAIAPWLGLFDEMVVLDDTEWRLMRGLVDVPTTVFPKVFGLPPGEPAVSDEARPIDVFVSGTVMHPYHTDKDRITLDLLRLDNTRLRLVNGFDPADEYFRNLARSKVCCTFVRHPGALPTRGLEALAAGCVAIVQEESVLHLFAGETDGVIAFGDTTGSLSTRIAHVLAHWDEYAPRGRRGAVQVRREFALPRVASEYLRVMTVLAARPRAARTAPNPASLVQKRAVVQKGWLPTYRFGGPLLREWAAASVARIDRQLEERESARLLNDRARELLLAHYHDAPGLTPDWLPQVIAPLDRAVARFPDALVPRFNLIRILFHYGDADAVARGLALLDQTLGRPDGPWRVDPLDDVLPWDFCPQFFNYRHYFDTVVAVLAGDAARARDLTQILRAGLLYYRARYGGDRDALEGRIRTAAQAVRLEPDFAEYVLLWCRLMLERGLDGDRAEAAAHLSRLAGQSARVLEIFDLARGLPPLLRGGWFDEVERLARRFWHTVEMRENLPEPPLRPTRMTAGPSISGRLKAAPTSVGTGEADVKA